MHELENGLDNDHMIGLQIEPGINKGNGPIMN